MKFSVVIPAYNEERSLPLLYPALKKIMDGLGQPYELIFVNDGSSDRTADFLRSASRCDSAIINVELEKNQGQSAALQAGFDQARGEYIITLDGDLQNDPADIPRLWDKLNEGYGLVCGWRFKRSDPLGKCLEANIAGILRRLITGEKIHDFGCGLRIFPRELLSKIRLSRGLHRFFALLALRAGYKVAELKVSTLPRRFGKSRYKVLARLPQCLKDFTLILSGQISG
jgi:glycosyltransferase involved in cell wall biosynthesis